VPPVEDLGVTLSGKRSLCQENAVLLGVMVRFYSYYANGFWFNSHFSNFRFVFFSLLFFRLHLGVTFRG